MAKTNIENPADSTAAGAKLCTHCNTRPARTGQSYCRDCHKNSMRQYRANRNLEFSRLNNALDQLTRNNTQTRRKFAETVGTDRWVIVTSEAGDQFHDFSGYVMGFLPCDQISILDEHGRMVNVPLKQVVADVNRWYPEDDATGAEAAAERIKLFRGSANQVSCR